MTGVYQFFKSVCDTYLETSDSDFESFYSWNCRLQSHLKGSLRYVIVCYSYIIYSWVRVCIEAKKGQSHTASPLACTRQNVITPHWSPWPNPLDTERFKLGPIRSLWKPELQERRWLHLAPGFTVQLNPTPAHATQIWHKWPQICSMKVSYITICNDNFWIQCQALAISKHIANPCRMM